MPKGGREPGDAGLLMNAADMSFRNPGILFFFPFYLVAGHFLLGTLNFLHV